MTELMPYRPRAELAVPAASDTDSWTEILTEVATLASQIANTPFVPDGLRGSAPAVAAAILSGRELGLGPMTSLANIHVIKGKPALSAALMRALILAQGHQIETVDISDTRAVVRGRRRGEAEWEEAAFTADQAKRAGIVLGGYPQDKLYARATSRLARRKFADVIAGMPYAAEELEDDTAIGDVPGAGVILPGESYAPLKDAAQAPKPRTAQRKARTGTSPAEPRIPQGAAPAAPAQAAGEALPPLPGEEDSAPALPDEQAPSGPGAGADPTRAASSSAGRDRSPQRTTPQPTSSPNGSASIPDETDYDTPGTATSGKNGQLTAIWTILNEVFAFSKEEKEQARAVVEHIIGRKLTGGTTASLSYNQAKTVLNTLSHWQQQAKDKGDEPRDYLIAVMVAQDQAGEPDGQ